MHAHSFASILGAGDPDASGIERSSTGSSWGNQDRDEESPRRLAKKDGARPKTEAQLAKHRSIEYKRRERTRELLTALQNMIGMPPEEASWKESSCRTNINNVLEHTLEFLRDEAPRRGARALTGECAAAAIAAFQSGPMVACTLTMQGNVLRCNEAADKTFGFAVSERPTIFSVNTKESLPGTLRAVARLTSREQMRVRFPMRCAVSGGGGRLFQAELSCVHRCSEPKFMVLNMLPAAPPPAEGAPQGGGHAHSSQPASPTGRVHGLAPRARLAIPSSPLPGAVEELPAAWGGQSGLGGHRIVGGQQLAGMQPDLLWGERQQQQQDGAEHRPTRCPPLHDHLAYALHSGALHGLEPPPPTHTHNAQEGDGGGQGEAGGAQWGDEHGFAWGGLPSVPYGRLPPGQGGLPVAYGGFAPMYGGFSPMPHGGIPPVPYGRGFPPVPWGSPPLHGLPVPVLGDVPHHISVGEYLDTSRPVHDN